MTAADTSPVRADATSAEERLTRLSPILGGSWLLAGAFAVVAGIAVWARNRGFDITDEGLYLLHLASPQSVQPSFTQFGDFVSLITGPFEPGIIGYRILRLVLLAGSAAVMAGAFHAFARARLPTLSPRLPGPVGLSSFVAVLAMLGYSWLPQTLSYNTASATLAQLETGLVLLLLARTRPSRPTAQWPAMLAGALLSMHLFVRWPTAVIVGVLLAGLIWAVAGWEDGRRSLAWLGGAVAAGIVLLTEEFLFGPFSISELREGSATAATLAHEPSSLLGNYAGELLAEIRSPLWGALGIAAIAALFIGPALGQMLSIKQRKSVAWGTTIVAGAALVLRARADFTSSDLGLFAAINAHKLVVWTLLGLVVAAGTALLVATRRRHRSPMVPHPAPGELRAGVAVGVVAALLPFAGAIGSGGTLLQATTPSAGGFGIAIVLLATTIVSLAPATGTSRVLTTVPLLIIASLVAAQIYNGTVRHPYRLATDLHAQNVPVPSVPQLDGLLVDATTAAFFAELSERAGVARDDRILALYNAPGLVYALGGVAPGEPWVRSEVDWVGVGTPCGAMVGPDVESTRLIILTASMDVAHRDCLAERWSSFAAGLDPLGAIANPYAHVSYFGGEILLFRAP